MTKKDLNDSRLFDLITNLDRREFAELGRWLNSPVHNKSEKVIKLYEAIKTKHRNGRPVNELLLLKYIGLIPSVKQKDIEPQHRTELRTVMHKLTSQIDDYLVWKKIKGDKLFARQQLMEVFLERGMHSHILPLITKSERELHAISQRDITYCERVFRVEEMRFYLNTILNNLDAKKMKTSVEDITRTLQYYSLSTLLRYYCATTNVERRLNIRQEYPMRETILAYLETHTNDGQPSVGVYHRMLKLLLNEQEEDYSEFIDFVFKHLEVFDLGEIRQFLNCAINYCTQMARQGNEFFIHQRHLIYEKGLELECWSQNRYFSQHEFMRIVQNALSLNEILWADNFINQYADLLKKEIKNIVVSYCKALVYHHKKEYEKAREHLPTQESPDFFYYIYIRILKVKIHYDSNDWETMPIRYNLQGKEIGGGYKILNELENIRQYVNRPSREITQNIREQYTNFKNILTRIFERKRKITYDGKSVVPQASLQALQTKLINTSPIIERKWLKEKIKELIQEIS